MAVTIQICIRYVNVSTVWSAVPSVRSRGRASMQESATRRRASTRERLLDAAREVLADTGIQGATVEQICERAGYTRGAFYSNYASKDDLILDLFMREKDRMLIALRSAVEDKLEGGDIGSIAHVLDRFVTSQPTDRTWFLVHQEFVTHAVRQHRIADVYAELWEQTHREFGDVIDAACQALGRRLTIDLRDATRLLIAIFDATLRDAFLGSDADEADLTAMREQIPTLLLALSEPAER
ncbi:TetR/AcrR family transcriptional regulator [Aeromicrobium camelliae]|uniref:TetR/AcrR family transcriptional regulator n=2 Tax=Aeromicrobium camelliae TaxID=1538144 RepID=A0A3N6XYI1_9ACTN|nr:TetR/AcrR family transcriptional regulator [Aeromicrobium camelliae]